MLEIKNLKFSFKDKVIFQDINLEFNAGQITGILGENGVGKTTFFRVLSGIYRQEHGNIMYDEAALTKEDISFLQTDPFFYPYMKGQEYLDLVVRDKADSQKFKGNPFELPLNDLIETYSTGMKKKLAFMGVLSQNRDVLILDEPYNGVDLQSNELLKLMMLKIKEHKTILVSSHILNTLTDICDQIYYFSKEKPVRLYSKDEFPEISKLLKAEGENLLKGFV